MADPDETGVRVVPLAAVPIGDVLALVRDDLGPGAVPWTVEGWRWKHLDNPFGPSLGTAALAGGRLVALRPLLRWRLRDAAGGPIEAVRAVDTVTRREWRGRGLFRRLNEAAVADARDRGVRLVFNTPNRVSRRGYLSGGWQHAGRVSLRARFRPRALRAVLRSPRSASVAPCLDAPPVSELLARPELAAVLAGTGGESRAIGTERSREYLAWRYGAAVGLEYNALWRFQDGKGACLVLRARARGPFREVLLAEVLSTPGPGGERALSSLLVDLVNRTDADHLLAVAPKGVAGRGLRRRAFVPLPPVGPVLVVRPLDDRLPDTASASGWRWSAGDLEVF